MHFILVFTLILAVVATLGSAQTPHHPLGHYTAASSRHVDLGAFYLARFCHADYQNFCNAVNAQEGLAENIWRAPGTSRHVGTRTACLRFIYL
jgi:hypothetical protein